jgi:hypothetical protein
MHAPAMRLPILVSVVGLTACARGGMSDPDAAAGAPDARATADAAPEADAAPPADAPPGTPDAAIAAGPHLLLSEVSLAPTEGELIEIANPTGGAVDLTDYYVTDVPTYFRLPAGTQTIDQFDFVARFPAGASIPAGGVISVAIASAAMFEATYGVAPDYALTGGTMLVAPAAGTYNLTNGGEPIVLFRWDGASDLVTDVDVVIAGTPTAGNMLAVKSAALVDGPDAGATPSAYATDANTVPTKPVPAASRSTKRILLEAGHETQGGDGNGVGGDDETSEDTALTWDTTYSVPTPGTTTLALP